MFEMLIFFQITLSVLIVNSFSPLLMALIIVLFSAIQGMICFSIFSKWMGLSIILVFVGGMMVAFLYVASLSSNNKFILTFNYSSLILIVLWSLATLSMMSCTQLISLPTAPSLLYSKTNIFMTLIMVSYLLCTLFIATKISESFKGSLIEKF